MYTLIAYPSLNLNSISEYVQLPPATQENGGGFYLGNNCFSYSPIDLAVVCLETEFSKIACKNLLHFFNTKKTYLVEHELNVAIKIKEHLVIDDIARWKTIILNNKDLDLLLFFQKIAPLTFKWVTIEAL